MIDVILMNMVYVRSMMVRSETIHRRQVSSVCYGIDFIIAFTIAFSSDGKVHGYRTLSEREYARRCVWNSPGTVPKHTQCMNPRDMRKTGMHAWWMGVRLVLVVLLVVRGVGVCEGGVGVLLVLVEMSQ
jgi:hypothetical protein